MSRHACGIPSCDRSIPIRKWACKKCWPLVPKMLQIALCRSYSPGNPETPDPEVARHAIRHVTRELHRQRVRARYRGRRRRAA